MRASTHAPAFEDSNAIALSKIAGQAGERAHLQRV
jgi:hypothetical protein